jgi:hypothetical protein
MMFWSSSLTLVRNRRRSKAIGKLWMPLVLLVTLRDQMDAALGSQRLITLLSNFFELLALLLSAIGLYGLLSSNALSKRCAWNKF